MIRILIFGALALSAAPALANVQSEIRVADQRVDEQRQVTARAVQTGDAATIASEQAKLRAAQAVAWGRRHPAQPPAPRVAIR